MDFMASLDLAIFKYSVRCEVFSLESVFIGSAKSIQLNQPKQLANANSNTPSRNHILMK